MYNICFTVDLTHLDFIAFLLQCLATLWESKAKKCANFNYRTRANKGRSRLVAAPLTFQAKKQVLRLFHAIIRGLKI